MGLMVNFMIIDCETGKILSRCHITGLTKVSMNMPSEKFHEKPTIL